jgi:hypothetical protein
MSERRGVQEAEEEEQGQVWMFGRVLRSRGEVLDLAKRHETDLVLVLDDSSITLGSVSPSASDVDGIGDRSVEPERETIRGIHQLRVSAKSSRRRKEKKARNRTHCPFSRPLTFA